MDLEYIYHGHILLYTFLLLLYLDKSISVITFNQEWYDVLNPEWPGLWFRSRTFTVVANFEIAESNSTYDDSHLSSKNNHSKRGSSDE